MFVILVNYSLKSDPNIMAGDRLLVKFGILIDPQI